MFGATVAALVLSGGWLLCFPLNQQAKRSATAIVVLTTAPGVLFIDVSRLRLAGSGLPGRIDKFVATT
jgi:hypothetical protein